MFTHLQIWTALDRLAESLGYSSSGLSKKAGLDPTSFNKSKRFSPDGKPRWPSSESISKVLAATGATMEELSQLMNDSDDFLDLSADAIAKDAAQILLDTDSVLFNAEKPFVLKSGRPSPVYIDCRRLISFTEARNRLMDYGAAILRKAIKIDDIDYIAGGETAGIPYAAFIAERLNKPMLYVRKEPKGYGRMAQIEGVLPEKNARGGKPNVILIEDLQTDGGSKKIFIDALREAGANVEHAFVVFHYGIFAQSEKNMKDLGITLHALTTWHSVIDRAEENGGLDKKTITAVRAFLKDPTGWQDDNMAKVK